MSKKSATDFPDVFDEIPIDQYVEENIEKFPEALPEDLSLEHYQKLLNDSRFFGEQGMKARRPKNMVDVLRQHKEESKALKGIKKEMSNKKAYPNYDEYIEHKAPSNTDKWIAAVKDIYYRVHKGVGKGQALEHVIAGWNDVEKLEFKNWLKYYEENAHKKYSEASNQSSQIEVVAQVGYWEDVNRAGYFVPVHRDIPKDDPRSHVHEIDLAKDPATNEGVQADEKREIIEKQRNKIVSRLDSAEKLLRSHEGQIFAGKEFEALMHIIYELKKKIHTVNKISTATKLYEDMIIREANILTKKGFANASEILFKIAEDKPLTPPPPPSPMTGAGNPGTVPGGAPGQTPEPNNPPVNEGMKDFLDGLAGKVDTQPNNDLEVNESNDELMVEAQVASPPDDGLEVEENLPDAEMPVGKDNVSPVSSNFDQKMDSTLQGVKVEDVVQKLEDLTKIYKTREMPRQLAFIDIMLDHLGLASFFPTLAEATNKALDSNQYILTRLEDITSRLRGTVQTNNIDLKGQNPIPSSPELEEVRNKLQKDQEQEKIRKQLKKEQENAQIGQPAKPEPELEVEEDLGGPVTTPSAAPTPLPPPAPAPAPVR